MLVPPGRAACLNTAVQLISFDLEHAGWRAGCPLLWVRGPITSALVPIRAAGLGNYCDNRAGKCGFFTHKSRQPARYPACSKPNKINCTASLASLVLSYPGSSQFFNDARQKNGELILDSGLWIWTQNFIYSVDLLSEPKLHPQQNYKCLRGARVRNKKM